MNKFNQMFLAVGLLTITGAAAATPILGSIGFTGDYQIKNALNAVVGNFNDGVEIDILNASVAGTVDGDFAAEGITSGDAVAYSNFVYNPFSSVSGLWSIGSFTFDLVNANTDYISNTQLLLSGTGWINSTTAGLDQAFGVWNFSANTAGSNFTWSSSTAAPEPGIALLLGVGLIGFGVVRKLRKAA